MVLGLEKVASEQISRLIGRPGAGRPAALAAAEVFGRDGVRIDLEKAMVRWSKQHARKPGAREVNAGGEYVQDFVTPLVSYLPRNPHKVPTAGEARQLYAAMEKNARAERAAYQTLHPTHRKQYHELKHFLRTRPDGQLGLQQLLLDGKLTMASAKNADRNLMEALHALQRQPLDAGLTNRRYNLMAELTQELADPVAVSQAYKGTCAATSQGQILWSLKNPTDYTDFVAGLASPAGKAKLPNGKWAKRPADWEAGNDRRLSSNGLPGQPESQGRTISSQLVEPVFMQVGYGKQYRYSNTFDAAFDWRRKNVQVMDGGLYGEQEARLLETLFPGKSFATVYTDAATRRASYKDVPKAEWGGKRLVQTKEEMLENLAATAASDNPIPTGVTYQLGGGHAILVTGTRSIEVKHGSTTRTERWVEYINPWGQKEVQREDAFKLVLTGLTTDGAGKGVVGS